MCFLPDNPSSASIVFPTIFQAKVLIKGDDWTKYEINIPYTSTKPSNSLLIYGETKVLTGYVYFNIDDIVVTIPPDAEFTSAVACPKLTLIPSNQNGLHTWTVTDASGQTVATTNTPTANFNNLLNGTYTVKHTVKDDECGEGVVSKTVKISCTECGCNFDKAITIVADPNGTNYSQLGYPITLGDAQHNGCISITGKLIIDENVTIFNCGNIIMDACSEIEILKGKTLTLNNNTISGCKKMWKGISVLDGGKLFMYDNTVRDAQWAVNATPTVYKNVLSFVNATRIIIKGNNFDKNYIGVNIIGRDGVANLIRQTPFTDNSFKGNDGVTNLLPLCTPGLPKYSATHGFAGIVIKNLPSFQVGASTDKYLTNTFSNLQNGILATNSKVSVNWAEFNTLVSEWTSESVNPTATTATGIAVLADKGTALVNKCEINKCGHGVYGIAAELTVTNNNMPEVYRGVEAVNSLIFNVSDNKNIYYRNRGIIARQLSYAASANYKILNNTI